MNTDDRQWCWHELDGAVRRNFAVVSGEFWQGCHLRKAIGERAARARWARGPVEPSGGRRNIENMLTVTEAAQRVGRSPGTVRRWVREGRLIATTSHGKRLIDPGALDEVRDEMYPMLPLPPEWQTLEDGSPAPNWVAAVALSRHGR